MKPRSVLHSARRVVILSTALLCLVLAGQAQQEKPTDEAVARKFGITAEQVRELRSRRGMTNQELLDVPAERTGRVLRRMSLPDPQNERYNFGLLAQKNEKGEIPAVAKSRALAQLQAMRDGLTKDALVAGIPSGPNVDPRLLAIDPKPRVRKKGEWESLGPGNVGGRTRAILVHPKDPKLMWIGSVGGGIWKSTDAGESFEPANEKLASLAVSCLAMDPANPDVIYAGTGEGFNNGDAMRGAGIFRTTNGGKKWEQIKETDTPDFHYINRLAVSHDGQVVLAATRAGLFRNQAGKAGWERVLEPVPEDLPKTVDRALASALLDVKYHPTDSKKCVTSGWWGRAFYSTDGGAKWKAAKGLPTNKGSWGRTEVTYATAKPNIVYAAVYYTLNGDKVRYSEIYRSENGGESFDLRYSGTGKNDVDINYFGGQGWYDNAIWAGDPGDADTLLVGGVDLWRSSDGGKTLSRISMWWQPGSPHADQHAIVAHPKFDGEKNKTIYVANDGGLFMAEDMFKASPSKGWRALNNRYAVTQFYSVAAGPDGVVGGTQDNGTFRFPLKAGPDQWEEVEGGDGGCVALEPGKATHVYGEYTFATIFRLPLADRLKPGERVKHYISGLTNVGEWTFKDAPYRIEDAKDKKTNFIAPFVLDPNKPERLLAGGLSLWRTNDAKAEMTDKKGPEWHAIKPPTGPDRWTNAISAIAVAPGNSDVIWVGHNRKGEKGNLFRTLNGESGQPRWERMDDRPRPLPDRYCSSITIDPGDSKIVYVTFGGYERDNVWRTEDDGKRWKNIGSTLPESPVRALAIHPKNPKLLYVGTEVGLFASPDGGTTWSPTNQGPANCAVYQLVWHDDTLYAATHGRGIFRVRPALDPE